jgi:hypothetical protein
MSTNKYPRRKSGCFFAHYRKRISLKYCTKVSAGKVTQAREWIKEILAQANLQEARDKAVNRESGIYKGACSSGG